MAAWYLMLALQLLLINSSTAVAVVSHSSRATANTKYIRRTCSVTLYPKLCYTSLSIYAAKIKSNPKMLAYTALKVTLAATKSTSVIINRCSRVRGLKPREIAAALDCVEEVGDALDELRDSMDELGHAVKGSVNFSFLISDVQTWVSAALTNEDTCVDGFDKMTGRVENVVRREILKIAHLTSNALALINYYASK